ncbi:MAG: fumarylacetoacetase [bacterium]
MTKINETHDASRRSWVTSADSSADFPIQNLPLGLASVAGGPAVPVIAIGDDALDLSSARAHAMLDPELSGLIETCESAGALNPLVAAGRDALTRLRARVSRLLRTDTPEGGAARVRASELLVPRSALSFKLPVQVGNYTDFYASIHHATNVGRMFRPDNPLLPNYKWVPIGYHGRASSVVVSGTAVRRPNGQTRDDASAPPQFGPTRRMDYELEVGAIIGQGNALGEPISLADAEAHMAGLCLVNDWSARDIQSWEYQPLGPFLSKSFATSVSPWIVTMDALEPFRARAFERAAGDPSPLPYLFDERNEIAGGVDITLEVRLSSLRMRDEGHAPIRVSRGSFRSMYWTMAQMLTHHASNGCNLRPGDLLASGTVSGETPESRGCLLERTWRGTEPMTFPTGEARRFLENGDEVTMRGWCEREGFRTIGFGEVRGRVSGD